MSKFQRFLYILKVPIFVSLIQIIVICITFYFTSSLFLIALAFFGVWILPFWDIWQVSRMLKLKERSDSDE